MFKKTFMTLLLTSSVLVHACTDFSLNSKNRDVVVGRSMEFAQNLQSEIVIFPKGEKRQTVLSDGNQGLAWQSKYDIMSITAFHSDLIADGMNEKGLSLGVLWFTDAKYPKPSKNDPSKTIPLEMVPIWMLGSFDSVDAAIKGFKGVEIEASVVKELGEVPPVHFSLHDRSGKSAVIEFIDGEMVVSENSVGVLTNNPPFDWHVTNLGNYINLTAINAKAADFDGTVLDPIGQGSGLLGIPGDWTPPSRFIRAALFKNFAQQAEQAKEAVNLAFHILNTVDIPYGTVRGKKHKDFDYTQWAVAKDLTHNKLYYRTYGDLSIKEVDLKNEVGFKPVRIKMDGA